MSNDHITRINQSNTDRWLAVHDDDYMEKEDILALFHSGGEEWDDVKFEVSCVLSDIICDIERAEKIRKTHSHLGTSHGDSKFIRHGPSPNFTFEVDTPFAYIHPGWPGKAYMKAFTIKERFKFLDFRKSSDPHAFPRRW